MPTYSTPQALRFPPAVTQDAVETTNATLPDTYIIEQLLQLSSYLIGIVENTTFFGPVGHDPYSPSLRTLHDRLHIGCIVPSPLENIAKDGDRVREILGQRVNMAIKDRPLHDFEDIYYAVLTRMRVMLQTINERLHSGFSTVGDLLFEGGPTLQDFSQGLLNFWIVLNEPEFAGTLDAAVRLSRVTHMYHEINRMVEMNMITAADAVPYLDDLYAAKDDAFGLKYNLLEHSPAVTAVYLSGRYGVLLELEKQEHERKVREASQMDKHRRHVKSKRVSVATNGVLGVMKQERAKHLDEHGKLSSAVLRPSPGKQVRFVERMARAESQEIDQNDGMKLQQMAQVVGKNTSTSVRRGGYQPLNSGQENLLHFGSDESLNFKLKKQRVSEHWKDLRDSVGDYGADSMEL